MQVLRLINEDTSRAIFDNLDEWLILAPMAIFLISYDFITAFGVILVSLLYPGLCSVKSIEHEIAAKGNVWLR